MMGGRLPTPDDFVRDFASRHQLPSTGLIENEANAIAATATALQLINQSYAEQSDAQLSDPTVGILLNVLHRNFEHTEAAIVAFVCGCGSSAEVVARTSVESSVNLLYILAGDRVGRLRAYFDHYLRSTDAQVAKWRASLDELAEHPEIHLSAIHRRLEANAYLRRVVDASFPAAGELWPRTVDRRFSAIGEAVGYRTLYARMSAEVHGDAEETLRYFVAKSLGDETLITSMALETVWTTRLYIYYAATLFLKVALAYAGAFSFPDIEPALNAQLGSLHHELMEISSHIGGDLS